MPIQITGFAPTQGPSGTNVTLTLDGMPADATTGNTYVHLGGAPVLNVGAVNPAAGTIQIRTGPNSQSGEFLVVIGTEFAQSASVFTVTGAAGAPQFTNMQPREAAPGRQITLTGNHLDQIEFVRVGNLAVTNIVHVGSGTIRFTLPQAAQSGQQRVYGRSEQYGVVNVPYFLTVQ